ncbi:ParA family protein [Thermodesulfovibrio yellowstonii]|uniref:ParA family protein n=1 Tax=Thermodesulfovibrio yellowstonii TaxID=28262 RepID=UPI00040EEE81|nr:ParA family protein [Thermodesulfovibrio islandicus]
MITITITNRKGGTGKSTVAVNLSAEFSARGKKVLLIDLDTQGHSTVGVGFEYRKGNSNIHSIFSDQSVEIEKLIHSTKWNNLFIAPADTMFEHSRAGEKRDILRQALKDSDFIKAFDFIIIDTAPSLDNLLINALVASDYVLIPFLPHFLSIEGIKSLARIFFKVASTENPSLRLFGLIPIMVNLRIHQHSKVTSSLSTGFGKEKMLPGIRNDIKIVEAFENKMPLIYYAPTSRASADFKILADELLKRISSVKR